MDRPRCRWCNQNNPLYVAYHDAEWGQPNFDEQYLYEMLILESFQAGLSWECVLNKRQNFRAAYGGFDAAAVAAYGSEDMQRLQNDAGIIRNKRKIAASIENSRIFLQIAAEYGSFRHYLEQFTGGKTLYETDKTTNALSDALSKDLQRRGMKFVGSTIIYSYLQAVGVISSHEEGCFLHRNEN